MVFAMRNFSERVEEGHHLVEVAKPTLAFDRAAAIVQAPVREFSE
jgi:hypothetical protein